ncbi:MAG: type II toxin-antitoxin system VapC family toxin [Hydrogenophaga sp.]|nr:type II toxin-antitoxin system VapC family toxin [Hydrogenophaga sp.]
MIGYLLDTSAISLFFNGRASSAFGDWLEARQREGNLFLSVVTLQELEKGAVKLARIKGGNAEKAARISAWIRELHLAYEHRLLSIDAQVALVAGQIEGRGVASGHNPALADVLIAATAEAYQLVVVTCNLKDFEALSVPCEAPI